jgi:hypothetical protein
MSEDLLAEWKEIETRLDAGETPEQVAAKPEEPVTETAAEEPAAEPEPSKPEPVAADDREAKRKQLSELAESLGLHVSEARVEPAERIKWRQEKAAEKAALKADRERFEAERQAHAGLAGKAEQASKLLDDGEADEALRLLFGKGLEDLNRIEVDKIRGRDPRVTKLEKELRAKEERLVKAEQERAEKEARETRTKQRSVYVGSLSKALSGVDEFKAFAAIPDFAERIVAIQEQAYDPDDDTTIPADVAARAVMSELRNQYAILSKAFGSPVTSEPESPVQEGSNPAKRSVKQRTVPQTKVSRAAGPGRTLTDQEWHEIAMKEMKAALTD